MQRDLIGLARYFYELQFYSIVREVSRSSSAPITVSAARALRAKVDDVLREQGVSFDDPTSVATPADIQSAFHEVFQDVPGYDGIYAKADERGTRHPWVNQCCQ